VLSFIVFLSLQCQWPSGPFVFNKLVDLTKISGNLAKKMPIVIV